MKMALFALGMVLAAHSSAALSHADDLAKQIFSSVVEGFAEGVLRKKQEREAQAQYQQYQQLQRLQMLQQAQREELGAQMIMQNNVAHCCNLQGCCSYHGGVMASFGMGPVACMDRTMSPDCRCAPNLPNWTCPR